MTYPSFGASSGIFPIYLGETLEEFVESVTDSIGFTSGATHNYFFETILQTFAWSNVVQIDAFEVLAADRLFFYGGAGQTVEHNYFWLDVENTFDFDDVSGYDQELDITQYIGFTDRYFAPTLYNTLNLQFSNTVKIATAAAVSNSFDWIDHESETAWPRAIQRTFPVSDTLVFSSIVAGGDEQFVYDLIGFEDVADSSGSTYERDAGELGLKDTVSFKITGSRCVEKEFSPYVGAGTDAYPAFSATAPTLGHGDLTLTHPRVGPSLTLTLKNPTFGNTDTTAFPKIDRVTRGGERLVFSDPDWGQSQVLSMVVENICDVDVDEVLTFLNTSLGKEIGLVDWEGRTWAGVILAPQTEVSKTVSGWRLQLVFEGELL